MQSFLDFLNNNSGFTALLGVVLGWFLSSVSNKRIYKLQKKDEQDKERRERFKKKAELSVIKDYRDGYNCIKELHIIPCPYEAKLDKNGQVETVISRKYANIEKLQRKVIYLKNTGKSVIRELEIASANPKYIALLDASVAISYIKNNNINYGVILDEKIGVGDMLALTIYYDKEMPINDIFSASIEIYFRDELNNICAQPLFVGDEKIYEPRTIEYKEWREQVNVDINVGHWENRLRLRR